MNRTVLVTGASGGIGCAVAKAFAQNGDAVVLGYNTNQTAAENLLNEIQALGGRAVLAQGDVASAKDVERLFLTAEEHFGNVDILINNAGIAQQKLFCDITEQEWDAMFDVHVKGTFLCCKRALPFMINKKNGCIINVSSMWGQIGASCESHYSAAKAAVIGLTKALAKEEAPSGVRVNCIAPGVVDTGMMQGFSAEDKKALCDEIPIGRIGTPEEVAQLAVYLASDAACYITGQTIAVNGGMVV